MVLLKSLIQIFFQRIKFLCFRCENFDIFSSSSRKFTFFICLIKHFFVASLWGLKVSIMYSFPFWVNVRFRSWVERSCVAPSLSCDCIVTPSLPRASCDELNKIANNFFGTSLVGYTHVLALIAHPNLWRWSTRWRYFTVTTATIEDCNARSRRVASQGGRNLLRQRLQLEDSEIGFISGQRGGFDDARKLEANVCKIQLNKGLK